jgi:hypothetical protein
MQWLGAAYWQPLRWQPMRCTQPLHKGGGAHVIDSCRERPPHGNIDLFYLFSTRLR